MAKLTWNGGLINLKQATRPLIMEHCAMRVDRNAMPILNKNLMSNMFKALIISKITYS